MTQSQLIYNPRFWCIITCYLEIFLICHDLVSFQTLEYAFRENNFYPEKSPEELTLIYNRLYTYIQCMLIIYAFLQGFLVDNFSLWANRLIAHIMMFVGALLAIFIDQNRTWLIWLAYPLFYAGGWALMYTCLFVFDYFPNSSAKITSGIGVFINLSQVWYLFYKEICIPFSNVKYFWVMMLLFQPLTWARTVYLTPKWKVNQFYQKIGWETRFDTKEMHSKISRGPQNPEKETRNESEASRNLSFFQKIREIFKQTFQFPIIILLIWWFPVQTKAEFWFANFQDWIRWKVPNDVDYETNISYLTKIFEYSELFNI